MRHKDDILLMQLLGLFLLCYGTGWILVWVLVKMGVFCAAQ